MKKKNDTRWLFCLILTMWLVWPAKSMAQVDDCYAPAYKQGLELMKQAKYADAILYFEAALSCPTAPEGNDAQAMIEKCQHLLEEPDVTLTVDGLLLVVKNMPPEGGTLTFDVSTTADKWSVTGTPLWADVKKGPSQFTLTCSKNTTGSKRVAKLKVNAGAKSVTVQVAQDNWADPMESFEITSLSFANEDSRGRVVGVYAHSFDADELVKVRAMMTYKAEQDLDEGTIFDVKIIAPDGTPLNGSEDYTFSTPVSIVADRSSAELRGYGPSGAFSSGRYEYEVWYNGRRLYASSFEVQPRVTLTDTAEVTVSQPVKPSVETNLPAKPSAETAVSEPRPTARKARRVFEGRLSVEGGMNQNVVTCGLGTFDLGLGFNVGRHVYLGAEGMLGISQAFVEAGSAFWGAFFDGRFYISPRKNSFFIGGQVGYMEGDLAEQERTIGSTRCTNEVQVDGLAYGANLGCRFGKASIGLYGIVAPYYIHTKQPYGYSLDRNSTQLSLKLSFYL